MKRIKFGVIGLGWFGEKHCEALFDLPQVELFALCTRRPERLKELADRFQVSRVYTDYNEMLADPALEAVSVVTMWDQHVEPTLAALEAGKHVFLEKPMASTVPDCEAIVRAAKASSKAFMVGHICRFNPRHAAAKAEIDSGAIGKIVSMYARRNIPASVSEGVLDKIGPIIGDAVHDTDLMLWFSGATIQTVYAQTLSVRGLRHPDLGWTMYRFEDGAIGVCENVWFLPPNTPFQIDERIEVIGTEGSLHIHENASQLLGVRPARLAFLLTRPTGRFCMECARGLCARSSGTLRTACLGVTSPRLSGLKRPWKRCARAWPPRSPPRKALSFGSGEHCSVP